MIVDFRRQGHALEAIQIMHDEPVDRVNSCKYLSTIFQVYFETRPEHRSHHKERAPATPSVAEAFTVDPVIRKFFYNSFIESVLTFNLICWFYNLNAKQRNPSQKLLNFSCKIICDQ